MNSMSLIRKIDDLGRIVLPKEIRNKLNINSGDDFEITIDNNKIIFEKYSKLDSFEDILIKFINCFCISNNTKIFITIDDKLINYNKENVTNIVSKIIKLRKIYINDKNENNIISNNLRINGKIIIYPLVISSDLLGSIILVTNDSLNYGIEKCKIIYNLIKNIIINK